MKGDRDCFIGPVNIGLLSVFFRFRGSISDIGFNFESHELWMIVRNYPINGKGCWFLLCFVTIVGISRISCNKKGIFPSMPDR